MMRIVGAVIIAGVAVGGCGKNVPLAGPDAPNDPRCPTTPFVDGSFCSDEGLTCSSHVSCGLDVSMCSGGHWSTVRCETTRHCPCLSNTDCDVGSTCSDGVCLAGSLPACGGIGGACCGGFCGSCGSTNQQPEVLTCTSDGLCEEVNPPDGTLGAGCQVQCDGTSTCDPGQYCPSTCLTCPCTDNCRMQAALCTLGDDQTCNEDATSDVMLGHCVASSGPFSATCTCLVSQNPQTGKCL